MILYRHCIYVKSVPEIFDGWMGLMREGRGRYFFKLYILFIVGVFVYNTIPALCRYLLSSLEV